MISKRLINKIIADANIENLKMFAQIAVEHLLSGYDADIKVINALELISGVANPYENKDIDKDKILEYVKKYAYKGENVESVILGNIDNFNLTMRVKYKVNPEDEYEHSYEVDITDVAANKE